jgi:type VI secretion system secreted protein Hcp
MAVDYYLKIDGIDGESADDKHKSEIQLLSYSWGGSQTTSVAGTGGSGAGKVDLSHLSIMKYLDKASPKLFKAMCTGQHIASATLTAIKAGADGKPFLTVTLTELFVSSLQLSASSEIPSESVSFSYNQIKMEYSTQDEAGNLTVAGSVTYNTKANKTT